MKKQQIIEKIKEIYIIIFFVYLMLNSILPYVNMEQNIIKDTISLIVMLVGIFLILYIFIFEREKFKKNNTYVLWAFIIVCILSSISMIEYGYIDNVKTII